MVSIVRKLSWPNEILVDPTRDPANVEFFLKNSTKAKTARSLKESGCDDIILDFVSDNRLERQHTISITAWNNN